MGRKAGKTYKVDESCTTNTKGKKVIKNKSKGI